MADNPRQPHELGNEGSFSLARSRCFRLITKTTQRRCLTTLHHPLELQKSEARGSFSHEHQGGRDAQPPFFPPRLLGLVNPCTGFSEKVPRHVRQTCDLLLTGSRVFPLHLLPRQETRTTIGLKPTWTLGCVVAAYGRSSGLLDQGPGLQDPS